MQNRAKLWPVLGCGLAVFVWATAVQAENSSTPGPYIKTYDIVDGYITVELLETPELSIAGSSLGSSGGDVSVLRVIDSTVSITAQEDGAFSVRGDLHTEGTFVFDGDDEGGVLPLTVGDFQISIAGTHLAAIDTLDFNRDIFEGNVALDLQDNKLTLTGPVNMGMSVADMLGNFDDMQNFGTITAEFDLAVLDTDHYVEPEAPAERSAQGGCPCPSNCNLNAGYDVAVCSLHEGGPRKWGTTGGISAYSIATTSMNKGCVVLPWNPCPSLLHPAIPQNMYRYKDGRFEQIGLSWLKHGFCALQGNSCGLGCSAQPGGCPPALGLGCTDPYSGTRNGQTNLGPHHTVNPFTGVYTCQYGGSGGTIGRRIQVHIDDLNPALNPGAVYFGEATYIHQLDASSGNHYNNASYRRINVGGLSGGAYTLTWNGGTVTESPAIDAWKTLQPTVRSSKANFPSDGRFWLYWDVTDNGDGTWHYEYALHNQNSDKAAGSFTLPLAAGVQLTNIGFHDVRYHSGDAWDSDSTFDGSDNDWSATVDPGVAITWEVPSPADPNSNALRYTTTYNFRFDANSPPTPSSQAQLGSFKTAEMANISTQSPSETSVVCVGDLTDDGDVGADDLAELLGAWGPCPGCPEDLDDDDAVGAGDLALLLGNWGPCK